MASGNFTLNFNSKKKGDQMHFNGKPCAVGYELMNTREMESWNINPSRTLNIVFCNKSRFDELCTKYYDISLKSYEDKHIKDKKRLEEALKENKMQKAEYERKLQEFESNYQNSLANIDKYVDQFARIDLSEVSEQEQAILAFVDAGKIDEAIAEYEKLDATTKLIEASRNVKSLEDAKSKIESEIDSQQAAKENLMAVFFREIDVLRMAGGNDNYLKIGDMYRRYIDTDTTNIQMILKYIDFLCNDINDFELCIKYCDLIKGSDLSPREFLFVINCQSQSYAQLLDMDNYVKIISQSLPQINASKSNAISNMSSKAVLADDDDDVLFIWDYISFCLNLARCSMLNEYYEASHAVLETLKPSLDIVQIDGLSEIYPSRYQMCVAKWILYNAILIGMEQKYEEAKSHLLHLTTDFKNSCKCPNTDDCDFIISQAHTYYGKIYLNEGKNDSAYYHLTKAYEMADKMSKKNIFKYGLYLANIKTELGNYYYSVGNYTTAMDFYNESNSLIERLKVKDSFFISLFTNSNNTCIAICLLEKGDRDSAFDELAKVWQFCRDNWDEHFETLQSLNTKTAYYYSMELVRTNEIDAAFEVVTNGAEWSNTDCYISMQERSMQIKYKKYQIDFDELCSPGLEILDIDEYLRLVPNDKEYLIRLEKQIQTHINNSSFMKYYKDQIEKIPIEDRENTPSYLILKQMGAFSVE